MNASVMENSSVFEQDTIEIVSLDLEHNGKNGIHTHSFFEMVYIDKGFSLHYCDGHHTVLTAGDIFILKPGQMHSYIKAHHTHLYNCLFSFNSLSGFTDDIINLPGICHIFEDKNRAWESIHLDLTERHEILICLEKMKWERLNKSIGWQIRLKTMMIDLLVAYSRFYQAKLKNGARTEHLKYIYEALKFLEQNLGTDYSVKDIADFCNISPDYLTKQFKNILGVSLMEYIKNYRIAKAMELLTTTDLPIAQIAQTVGFGDISHFSRQFKQVSEVSPLAFRKNKV